MMFKKGPSFMGRDYLHVHQVILESREYYSGYDILSKPKAIPHPL